MKIWKLGFSSNYTNNEGAILVNFLSSGCPKYRFGTGRSRIIGKVPVDISLQRTPCMGSVVHSDSSNLVTPNYLINSVDKTKHLFPLPTNAALRVF